MLLRGAFNFLCLNRHEVITESHGSFVYYIWANDQVCFIHVEAIKDVELYIANLYKIDVRKYKF